MSDDKPALIVMRCDACGEEITEWGGSNPVERHGVGDCPRGGGEIVARAHNACGVAGCKGADRGVVLHGNVFAQHMDWHRQQWEKDDATIAALPMEHATPAAPRTVDVWCDRAVKVEPGEVQLVTLASPVDGARCVAVLAYPPLPALVVGCDPVGAVPLAAYVGPGGGAVVPLEGLAPADCYEVEAHNDGDADLTLRLGARWELPE